jgi:Family of unknown function (DUF6159)
VNVSASQSATTPGGEGRLARSWRLTKASWQVVRDDRSLLALGGLSVIVGGIGLALIFILSGSFHHGHLKEDQIALFALILAYPLTFLSVFLNTAIAAAAAAALEGRRLTVGQALAVPMRRIGAVAVWALIAAVVGVVLEQLASRLPLGGSIAARLVGVGWALASLFAVPILALDGCSAPEALKRSAHVVKKRWGEGIGGTVIIGAWMGLAMLGVIVVFAIGAAAANDVPAVRDAIIVVGVLALAAVVALQLLVRQTFAVALYRYATTGEASGPFAPGDLQSPFGRRRGGAKS